MPEAQQPTIHDLRRGDRIVYTTPETGGIYGLEVFHSDRQGAVINPFELKKAPNLQHERHLKGRSMGHHALISCMQDKVGEKSEIIAPGMSFVLAKLDIDPSSFFEELPEISGALIVDRRFRVSRRSWWV